MIHFMKGNLFDLYGKVDVLTNTVNCVGVMGGGIALQFRDRFRTDNNYFIDYVNKCVSGSLKPGIILWSKLTDGSYICNFPTKDDWRNPSEMSYIIDGLDRLVKDLRTPELSHIKSIAMPGLGCGLGGLKADEVKKLIVDTFDKHLPDIDLYLFM